MSPAAGCRDLVRIYVWEWPVRVTHWVIFGSIVVLAATGFAVAHPPGTWAPLGTVKAVHSYSAIAFTLAVGSRILWMFMGNRYSRWWQFVPVRNGRWRGLGPLLRFYFFLLRKPPDYVGHNPLAGVTYSLVLLVELCMIATGFALYSVGAPFWAPMSHFQFLAPLFGGLQTARWIHHAGMWVLLGFAVHHVYSAVLMSQVEANATIESIFSGYKFMERRYVVRAEDRDAAPPRR